MGINEKNMCIWIVLLHSVLIGWWGGKVKVSVTPEKYGNSKLAIKIAIKQYIQKQIQLKLAPLFNKGRKLRRCPACEEDVSGTV